VRDDLRAVQKNLPDVLSFFNANFREHRMYIVENDSVDGTKSALRSLEASFPNVRCILLDGVSESHSTKLCRRDEHHNCQKRTVLLGELRQMCLEACMRDWSPDFVFVFDADFKNLWYDGIFNSFGNDQEWDVVCANSFRVAGNNNIHTYDIGSFSSDISDHKPFKMASELKKCEFCFGSMSLYRGSLFLSNDFHYDGTHGIEHIDMVKSLSTDRVFANPNMIVEM
jgi:hypothetical protein